jgi:hypothetical protein
LRPRVAQNAKCSRKIRKIATFKPHAPVNKLLFARYIKLLRLQTS